MALSQESFAAGIDPLWISSTKAELTAVVTALLTTPINAIVDIYIDSKNIIDTYKSLLSNNTFRYPRECLKVNHIDLWFVLFEILSHHHITLTFHKVKAHNNNRYNE